MILVVTVNIVIVVPIPIPTIACVYGTLHHAVFQDSTLLHYVASPIAIFTLTLGVLLYNAIAFIVCPAEVSASRVG